MILRPAAIDTFITEPQRMIIEDMSLQPDFSRKRRANLQWSAGQRARVHQHFQLQSAEVHIHPIKLAPGERVSQRLKGDHASAEYPIIFMSRA